MPTIARAASFALAESGPVANTTHAPMSSASAFFPALVLGVFWPRANRWGAVAGMLAGLGVTLYYLMRNDAWLRAVFRVRIPVQLWFDIQPIAAAVFGVPAGAAVIVLVSLLTPAPGERTRNFVRSLRFPRL